MARGVLVSFAVGIVNLIHYLRMATSVYRFSFWFLVEESWLKWVSLNT